MAIRSPFVLSVFQAAPTVAVRRVLEGSQGVQLAVPYCSWLQRRSLSPVSDEGGGQGDTGPTDLVGRGRRAGAQDGSWASAGP